MGFWLIAAIDSGPIRVLAFLVRFVGWLVIASAIVIWWGIGGNEGDPAQAILGFAVGAVVWAIGTVPSWLVNRVLPRLLP